MQKQVISFTLGLILLAGGCASAPEQAVVSNAGVEPDQVAVPEQIEAIPASGAYAQETFTLILPTPYDAGDGLIRPHQEGDFPYIITGITDLDVSIDELLQQEKDAFAGLCGQTESCGEIISSEQMKIGGKDALKFTVRYPGRSIEDRDGYLDEFHYTILSNGKAFGFWTSVSDLDDPENIEQQFREIIETVQFN